MGTVYPINPSVNYFPTPVQDYIDATVCSGRIYATCHDEKPWGIVLCGFSGPGTVSPVLQDHELERIIGMLERSLATIRKSKP